MERSLIVGMQMIKTLDDYDDLSDVPKQRRLHDYSMLELLRKAVPVEYVAVGGLDLDGYHFGRGQSIDTDMPPAFIETYFAEALGERDPVVVLGTTALEPFTEGQANDISAPSQKLLELKRFFGINDRVFIPIAREGKAFGGVCFTTHRPLTLGEFEFLVMTAEPLHRSVTKPLMDRFAESLLKLTAGEVTCLQLASAGLTSEEIAETSKYQTETVNSYLKSATKKLGAANRVEAVATAIRRGLIA